MSNNVKFFTGSISKLQEKNADGTPVVPIVPGQVYFAMADDNSYGYIVYDVSATERVVMSSRAEEAQQTVGTLTIGDYTYNGSSDVNVPVYDGSALW